MYTQVGCKVGAEDFLKAKTMNNPILIHASTALGTAFGDPRLIKRGQHQSINIRQINRNWAEQMGYYRFLENENITLSELVRSLSDDSQVEVGQRHVLAIRDSSEINLQSLAGRLSPSGLGVVRNNTDVGYDWSSFQGGEV